MKGSSPDSATNKYNLKNLKKLIDTIAKLDAPVKTGELEETNFPFEIPMHYDLSHSNITIDEDDAGIFDFEYLSFVDLDDLFKNSQNDIGYYYPTPHLSDIPGLVSNLATFEHRAFIKGLQDLEPKETREIFINYLNMKSDYYSNIAMKLDTYNEACGYISQPTQFYEEKYTTHAKLLKQAYKDPKSYSDINNSTSTMFQRNLPIKLFAVLKNNDISVLSQSKQMSTIQRLMKLFVIKI